VKASRGALAIGAVVLALVTGRPAFAEEPAAPTRADGRARAQQLFDSALTDAEAGNFAAACPKFLASQEADPKTSTLLNLAACYEKNGQSASAWGAYREAEGLARKAQRADWESTARARAVAIEPSLVRLTVSVPEGSRIPGLVVTRDGVRITVGEWGVAIPVDPGEHVVAASAEGRTPWETRATVRESSGAVTIPTLEEGPRAAAPPPVVAPAAPSGEPNQPVSWWTPARTGGVIAIGVGGLGVAAGLALGLVANGNYDDARSACSAAPRGCPAGAVADSDSAYGLATGATVVSVIGLALLAGGGAVVLLAPSPSRATGANAKMVVGAGSVGVVGRW